MGKTAFITGITGQDGAYLSKMLIEKGYEVHGGVRRIGVISTGRLDDLGITNELKLHDFELLELTNIYRTIDKIAPDEVYNLAAQSFVGVSFEQPIYTGDADALGALRILEAIRELGGKARFYQASTSEMFGLVQETPQSERTPFYPRSPYGVAKLFAHWSTVNYRESFNLHASSGILFNHESPLRGKEFVTRKVTLGFARMFSLGDDRPLELGNLDAKRDWGHARDFVEAQWLILQQDTPRDYVIATGIQHSVREFVTLAAREMGVEIEFRADGAAEHGVVTSSTKPGSKINPGDTIVRIHPQYYRPAEVDTLLGDASFARRHLGWTPKTSFDALVQEMAAADFALAAREAEGLTGARHGRHLIERLPG